MQVDLKKVKQVSARQFLNPNDYKNQVNVINATKKTVNQNERKIPVEARTVAIRSLESGKFEINEEKIKWAIEQLVEKNGGKNEFYDTQKIS